MHAPALRQDGGTRSFVREAENVMAYSRICISSGHGLKVRGASGFIDEVDEARLVVEKLAGDLVIRGVEVRTFHDDTSTTQDQNLKTIVNWHNTQGSHDLDISACISMPTRRPPSRWAPRCCISTQADLAADLSDAIAAVGFIDRGPKKRTDLYFLNNTTMPAVLLEVCFVDSEEDCRIYADEFDHICANLADCLAGDAIVVPPEPEPPASDYLFEAVGTCSHFGGPDDHGRVGFGRLGLSLYDQHRQSASIPAPSACWNDWPGAAAQRQGRQLRRLSLGLRLHPQRNARKQRIGRASHQPAHRARHLRLSGRLGTP